MPELRVVRGAHVQRLSGLECFGKLENLVNLWGTFDSLVPLADLNRLTHINILESRVENVEPIANLPSLRSFCLYTGELSIDISPLSSLPILHEITVKCEREEIVGLDAFQSVLEPWDIEFRAPEPRYVPSLQLDVVDQKTFDVYDTEKAFNVDKSNVNESMLSSELDWLDSKIEEVLSADFEADEDYTIPFRWGGARSRTVVLLSDAAIKAFPDLVLGVQGVLASAKRGLDLSIFNPMKRTSLCGSTLIELWFRRNMRSMFGSS